MLLSVANFSAPREVRPSSAHEVDLPRENRELVAPKPVDQSSGARLAYDAGLNRTFVEFLDSDTGQVVTRFPFVSPYMDTNTANYGLVSRGPGELLNTFV